MPPRIAPRPLRRKPRSPLATPSQACGEDTDWARIVGLYAKLGEVTPSPVVELTALLALAM